MEKENRTNWIFRALILVFVLGVAGNILFFTAQDKPQPVSRVKADMRTLAPGIETYYLDYGFYPAHGRSDKGANAFLEKKSPSRSIYTFRIQQEGEFMAMLTTPVAIVTTLPRDPFAKEKGTIFGYYCDGPGWILFSPGPDGVYDIDPVEDYDSSIPQPSGVLLLRAYDPSNGMVSWGDIFRVKM